VYEVPQQQFVLYLDRKLATEGFVAIVARWFGLSNEKVLTRFDQHYWTG
jgi:hypothetical protein